MVDDDEESDDDLLNERKEGRENEGMWECKMGARGKKPYNRQRPSLVEGVCQALPGGGCATRKPDAKVEVIQRWPRTRLHGHARAHVLREASRMVWNMNSSCPPPSHQFHQLVLVKIVS